MIPATYEVRDDPDVIRSAMYTPAPAPHIEGKVGSSHWSQVVTVYTETNEAYLVTGYDHNRSRLSECRAFVPVQISSIYEVFDRDHPAIRALHMQNAPHTHYTGP
jgi:hypothetical protein